jgi:autotransporter-associated beta strand protein
VAINSGTFTISGIVAGTGSLTKSGAGTLALTAANSYTGNTAVQAGTLRLSNSFLNDSASVLLSTGATLDLQFAGTADTIQSLLVNGTAQVIGSWGAVGNIHAEYHTSLIIGAGVLQVAVGPVVGDYNNDGMVGAADYLMWRRKLGAANIANRDPNNVGVVGQADYNSWRAHFGQAAGSGMAAIEADAPAAAAVPEISTSMLSAWAAICLFFVRRR